MLNRNQSISVGFKLIDWGLYDGNIGLQHKSPESVNTINA